jgi:hypothetical protein
MDKKPVMDTPERLGIIETRLNHIDGTISEIKDRWS